jgi:pyruvate,orthophosphate dikinase
MKAIYRFGKDQTDGEGSQKDLLGGKGASLAAMAKMGLPVPPGFTITTEQCVKFQALQGSTQFQDKAFLGNLMDVVKEEMARLEKLFGYLPLVSVRSGARVSMPGMMDTILNVGLTSQNLGAWAIRLGDDANGDRAALDSYRRLIQMLGSVALGVPHRVFDEILAAAKAANGVKGDTELSAAALQKDVIDPYLATVKAHTGKPFPDTLEGQLEAAIEAVFKSWNNERAKEYRKLNKIPENWGTAVTVQAMVFGNTSDKSCSGVLFTRNPSNGDKTIMGEFLPNAQGEDVVAGIRTPLPLSGLMAWNKDVAGQIAAICDQLEAFYKDMVDVEFTVQEGELFILQSRVGKRGAQAAFRIAVDLVQEGVLSKAEALKLVNAQQYLVTKRPRVADGFKVAPNATGLPACNGVVTGRPVFSAKDAVKAAAKGDKVILVTEETNPDDIAGMNAAVGVLTFTGGATSHAAVVARAMDKPCITGCTELKGYNFGGVSKITICGATGRVWFDQEVPVTGGFDPNVSVVVGWLFETAGVVRRSDALEGTSTHVIAATWYEEPEKANAFLPQAEKLGDRSKVLIDLTPPSAYREKADTLLWSLFGEPDDEASMLHNLLDWLRANHPVLAGCAVFCPEGVGAGQRADLTAKGYKVVSEAKTVADLLNAQGAPIILTDSFIQTVLGGTETLAVLKEKGVVPEQTGLPPSRTVDELVFERLGQ